MFTHARNLVAPLLMTLGLGALALATACGSDTLGAGAGDASTAGGAGTLENATIVAPSAASVTPEATAELPDRPDPASKVTPGPTTLVTNTDAEPAATDADAAAFETGPTAVVTDSAVPAASEGGAQTAPEAAIVIEKLGDLDEALVLAAHPQLDLVVVGRRSGQVHAFIGDGRGSWVLQEEAVLSVADLTTSNKERGLLGLTFSPDGSFLYVVWTDADTGADQLVEFTVTDGAVDPSSARLVLEVAQPFANHNGGNVVFGPDGFLYFGLGDGGGGGDPLDQGQDPSTLLGSILRIDPAARDAGAYGIPADNPYVAGGGAPEVFLYGVRNPWRFSFDAATGDLWVADVGQQEFEEITFLPASAGAGRGANLGWNLREGFAPYEDAEAALTPLVDPVFAYDHSDGRCSITGGFVYRGQDLPQLTGAYIFGDYCTGEVFALTSDGTNVTAQALDVQLGRNNLASFGEDPDGEIWLLTLSGAVLRLVEDR